MACTHVAACAESMLASVSRIAPHAFAARPTNLRIVVSIGPEKGAASGSGVGVQNGIKLLLISWPTGISLGWSAWPVAPVSVTRAHHTPSSFLAHFSSISSVFPEGSEARPPSVARAMILKVSSLKGTFFTSILPVGDGE